MQVQTRNTSKPAAATGATPCPGLTSAPTTAPTTTLMLTRNEQPIPILLVDDDADCRMLIRDAIAECNVSNRVYEVANGQEAIDSPTPPGRFPDMPRPGLIFMDIEMPAMAGLTALRRIRAVPELQEIPIVMMT